MMTAEEAWRAALAPVIRLAKLADEWDSVLREVVTEPRRYPVPYFWLGAQAERA